MYNDVSTALTAHALSACSRDRGPLFQTLGKSAVNNYIIIDDGYNRNESINKFSESINRNNKNNNELL